MLYCSDSNILEESSTKTNNPSLEFSTTNLQNDINNLDIQYFYNLDSENKICFDCGGPFPSCVSINHGIFLCENCAKNHLKLGNNISFIHRIKEPWDLYLLSYATRGGNSRFKRLCMNYEVPCQSLNENDEEKLNKYKIRLGEYQRLLLRSEILAEEPPESLYTEVAKDKCNLDIIYFPEFLNYQLYRGSITVDKHKSIGGKIWDGTKNTMGVLGAAGGIIFKVGKPVVGFIGKTAFKGLKYVGKSLWNYSFGNNNKNVTSPGNESCKKGNINDINNVNRNDNNINIRNNYDFAEEDLKDIRTIDITDKNNNNENMNKRNIVNGNKYNIFTIDDNDNSMNNKNNNGFNMQNNNINDINKHENIISDWNIVQKPEYIPINKQNNNSFNSINEPIKCKNIKYNLMNDNDITKLNLCKDKEENSKTSSLLESNSFAQMGVSFENTDKEKARKDANSFLLMP